MTKITMNKGRIVLQDSPVYRQEWREGGGAVVPAQPQTMVVNGYPFELVTTRSGALAYEFRSSMTIQGLKLMEVCGDRLQSTYYPPYGMPFEYQLGVEYEQRVQPKMGGMPGAGLYLYLTVVLGHFMAAFEAGFIVNPAEQQRYAVVYCTGEGPFIAYDVTGRILPNTEIGQAKKVACSRLRVHEIIHTFWN